MSQLPKTPLSHLTNNMTFELDFERIENLAAKVIIQREPTPEWELEKAQSDASLLTLLVKSLVDDLHRLNSERENPMDLCPICGGRTWGRPSGEDVAVDFTRLKCHRCATIRPDPGDE